MSLADYLDAPIPKLVQGKQLTGTSKTKPSYSKMDDVDISVWDSFESEASENVQLKSLEFGPVKTPSLGISMKKKKFSVKRTLIKVLGIMWLQE
jgi:hypothetical protein